MALAAYRAMSAGQPGLAAFGNAERREHMNHKALCAFRLIVERGSLSQAAAGMNLSQPAVSRLIALLETELELTLFDRSGRSLKMTKEGIAFYHATKHILIGLDEIPRIAKDISIGDNRLKLITTQRISQGLISIALATMRKENPNVRCMVDVLPRIDMENLVGMRRFDVAIASLPVKHALVEVSNDPLFKVRIEVVVPKGHALAGRETFGAADLEGEELVGLWPDQLWRKQIDDVLRSAGVTGNYVIETRSSLMACRLVSDGVGVTFLDRISALGLDLSGVCLKPMEPARWLSFGAIHYHDQPLNSNAVKFLDVLRRTIERLRRQDPDFAHAVRVSREHDQTTHA
jgi:DNA-binding transcriptional LysR family regulator